MERKQVLEYLLSFVVFLGILSWLSGQAIFWKIAIALGLLSLLSSVFALLLAKAWSALLKLIGHLQSYLIMGIFFFMILSPLAWLKRLLSKDPLAIKKPNSSSFFKERNHQHCPEDFEKMW